MQVKIKLLKPEAKLPQYSRPGDAGLDVFSCEDYELIPGERHVFKLGFALEIPLGTVSLFWDRGGMATAGIHSIGGVIDSNYRGEYCLVLYNLSDKPYQILTGDKIGQLIIQKFEQAEFEQVAELSESNRGAKGWFSSGK